MKAEMRPIPAKFHYTFNLRDVSKVVMGLTQSNSERIRSEMSLLRLFIHEGSRVFCDRLIDQKDKEWFYEQIVTISKSCFLNVDKEKIKLEDLFYNKPVRFTAIVNPGVEDIYEDVESFDRLVELLEEYQNQYNAEPANTNKLNLVFFKEAVDHILRIYRVLNQPRGNLMLVGIGGLGKQSLTTLATSIIGFNLQKLDIPGGNFSLENFKQWMREQVLLPCAGPTAGKDGIPTTFQIIDNQVVSDSILEMINSILNSGEVPNIFSGEEKQQLIDGLSSDVLNDSAHANLSPEDIF